MTPASPRSIKDLGIEPNLVQELALRYLREHGTGSLTKLRRGLKLSYPVVSEIYEQLRVQQLVEVRGTIGSDYVFSLTGPARELASESSKLCRYAGAAPVSLAQYTEVVREQRLNTVPSLETLRKAFSDLVLDDATFDLLGPALASGRPIFIYGPSGNGKTSLIERMPEVFNDEILVPYAIEVDGHIISIYDPLVHRAAPDASTEETDERWVRCRRPCLMAAGELVPSMLNLQVDERSGIHTAPLQMKATNGILLIDDFGRQAMPPRELLNRWILPLDRHVDYLSLEYGLTFQIPFELLLVFATNLDPSELADEAFLRRVPNKIHVGQIDNRRFDEILRRELGRYNLGFDPGMSEHMRDLCRKHNPAGLRGCYPRDICHILASRARYRRQPFALGRDEISLAVSSYFTQIEDVRESERTGKIATPAEAR